MACRRPVLAVGHAAPRPRRRGSHERVARSIGERAAGLVPAVLIPGGGEPRRSPIYGAPARSATSGSISRSAIAAASRTSASGSSRAAIRCATSRAGRRACRARPDDHKFLLRVALLERPINHGLLDGGRIDLKLELTDGPAQDPNAGDPDHASADRRPATRRRGSPTGCSDRCDLVSTGHLLRCWFDGPDI